MYTVGDTVRREEWSGGSLRNNQEEEERLRKLQNDQELRRRQEEEMAQVYQAKYSRVNGGSGDAKVFNTYGDNLSSPLIRAHIDYSTHLQIEKELNSVSKATPRLRQKWQNEETRVTVANDSSPVSSRKHSYDNLIAVGTSAGQDDKAALEEQLRKLQLEAQLAR